MINQLISLQISWFVHLAEFS